MGLTGTHPGDAQDAAGPAAWAAALLHADHPGPAGLRTWNGSDPRLRLAVYRNNVVSSLIDALADTFAVVQQLVGEDFFRAMAARFVRQAPPRSRVLALYGADFAAFIDGFDPARGLPYLGDVARLEFARVHACHAADVPAAPAEAMSRALACGERLGEVRLGLHPALSALASPFAVVSLWAAHQLPEVGAAMATIPIDGPEAALVLRDGLDVLVLRAPAGADTFVHAARAGQGLGEAAARAQSAAPDFDLCATLSLLLAHGALTALHLPEETSP